MEWNGFHIRIKDIEAVKMIPHMGMFMGTHAKLWEDYYYGHRMEWKVQLSSYETVYCSLCPLGPYLVGQTSCSLKCVCGCCVLLLSEYPLCIVRTSSLCIVRTFSIYSGLYSSAFSFCLRVIFNSISWAVHVCVVLCCHLQWIIHCSMYVMFITNNWSVRFYPCDIWCDHKEVTSYSRKWVFGT